MAEKSSENAKSKTKLLWLIPLAILLCIGTVLIIILSSIVALVGADQESSSSSGKCMAEEVSGPGVTNPDSAAPPGDIRQEQIENAKKIDQVASELGLPGQASKIAITAAMGESSLMNLDYGDEAQGVTNPDGSATTSKGLFQQQSSTGWGTPEQTQDPEYSTKSFLLGKNHDGSAPGLVAVPDWQNREITVVIHEVQSNADPSHYSTFYSEADAVIDEAGIDVQRSADDSKQGEWAKSGDGESQEEDSEAGSAGGSNDSDCTSGSSNAEAGKAGKSGDGENTYPWDDITPGPGVYTPDPLGFFYGECTSYSAWKVNQAMGGDETLHKFHNTYGEGRKGNAAEWKSAWERNGWKVSNTPAAGTVAWWDAYDGEGIGSAGHVGWVDEVTEDGKVVISEYNNAHYGPPGHKYSVRPEPVDPSEVSGYLYVPDE